VDKPWRSTRTWPTENKDGLTGKTKKQLYWVVEIGGRIPRLEVAGDIGLRSPRPTQDFTADDDGDYYDLGRHA